MICSKSKLDNKIRFISGTLSPEGIVQSVIRINDFNKIKPEIVQKCKVYLQLPWFGEVSDRFARPIFSCKQKCYFSANLCCFVN